MRYLFLNMKRRELRENVFKIIFHMNEPTDDLSNLSYYFEDNEISGKDKKYIENEVMAVINNISAIDELIGKNLKNYSFDRISKVSLALLRVAVYEIMYENDIPDAVAISEAVTLSEIYEDEKAKAFVNGILGSVARQKAGRGE